MSDADDTRPVMIFDSGIGGLSILRSLRRQLPDAPIVYAADYAGLPYGSKSEAELAARVPALLGRLVERYRPCLVIIACNTASTIALDHVRSALDLPVVGTVPAIKPAAAMTQSRVIGLLGTEATIRQPYVDRLASEFAADCTLLRHGAPQLVMAAEQAIRGETVDPAIYADALAGLTGQPGGTDMDVIVLACTHFPLVQADLEQAVTQPLRFVDGADGIARRTATLLDGREWSKVESNDRFVSTSTEALTVPLCNSLEKWGFARCEAL